MSRPAGPSYSGSAEALPEIARAREKRETKQEAVVKVSFIEGECTVYMGCGRSLCMQGLRGGSGRVFCVRGISRPEHDLLVVFVGPVSVTGCLFPII